MVQRDGGKAQWGGMTTVRAENWPVTCSSTHKKQKEEKQKALEAYCQSNTSSKILPPEGFIPSLVSPTGDQVNLGGTFLIHTPTIGYIKYHPIRITSPEGDNIISLNENGRHQVAFVLVNSIKFILGHIYFVMW